MCIRDRIAFAANYPVKERWAQIQAGAVILVVAGVAVLTFTVWPMQFHTLFHFVLAPFSDQELTTKGFEEMCIRDRRMRVTTFYIWPRESRSAPPMRSMRQESPM